MFESNMRTASRLSDAAASPSTPPRADVDPRRLPMPPGPKGRLFFGTALEFLGDPLPSIDALRDRYGDTTMSTFGPYRFVFVHQPDDVQRVLVTNHRNYFKSRSYEGLRLALGNGLVTSEGDFWRRQRKLSQPAFHRQRLEGLVSTMVDCVERAELRWRSRGDGELDLHKEMMRLTLGIVGHTLFSVELANESNELGPAVSTILEHANKYAESLIRIPLWMPTPANFRFRAAKRRLDETVHRIIAERRADPEDRGDLLSMLMAASDGDERMTDAQLRDEVLTFFAAGHETIAVAMGWTFLMLSQYPEAARRIREEVREVVGDGRITFETLPRLQYTGWVISEVMRLYPPVWIIEREALADDVLGGYWIPKGTIVAVSPWGLHHSPKLWDDPTRFDPERFSEARSEGRSKYAYLPFGGGPRVCIGNHFAMMESKVIVAMLLRSFDIDVERTPPPTPVPRVTLRPEGGMPARVSVR